jgi:LysM repeat protein
MSRVDNTGGLGPMRAGSNSQPENTATVQAGETKLADVATRLGVSLKALLDANPQLKDPNSLKAGQDLRLPQVLKQAPTPPPMDAPLADDTGADPAVPQYKNWMSDSTLDGSVMRANLNSKMPTFPSNPGPVEKVRMMQFMGEGPDKIGKAIADVAKYDPATAAKMLTAVSNGSDPSAISSELAKNLSGDDLKKLTNKTEGRQFLDQVENSMNTGNGQQAQMDRVRNARLSGPTTPQERAGLLLRYAMRPGDLKDQWLGNQLADGIKKNSVDGMRTATEVLTHALPSDRAKIASRIAENLDHQKLKDLAKTPDGKNFLQLLSKELIFPPPSKHPQANRMESAQIAAGLESNPAFTRLSEPTRKNVSNAIERGQWNADVCREIASLATTPGFEKLSEATRNELLEAMVNKGGDSKYAGMIRSLVGDAEFQGLNDPAKTSVLDNLNKFTETANYTGMSAVDQVRALNIIGNLALHSASNPTNVEANNTLKHLANGTVALKLYEAPGSTVAGEMKDGTLYLNVAHHKMVSPSSRLDKTGRGQLLDTSAHELNHLLNSGTDGGTRERFLDEYRAFYVGTLARGENPPTVATLKARINHLAANAPNGSSYDHLRELYKKDPAFKRVVDKMLSDLTATPPKITTPEDLRSELLALPGGYKSKYLTKIPNLDNHY